MTPTEEKNYVRMYMYLKEITRYQTPEQLSRGCRKGYGLEYEEALEYAYENVIETAKQAVKGIRFPKKKETPNEDQTTEHA
jgi:hypothetical protein